MKTKFAILFFCLALLLPGCSALSPNLEKEPVENKSHLLVGHSLEVENTDSRFILVDDNSALAADGLYYVSWGMGDPTPYENSDGDTVDLYDAQLYFLLGEFKDAETAQNNLNTWLSAGRTNYEILSEENVTCNGQDYLLITYQFIHEDNPYVRGISAFGVFGNHAACIELTCREGFDEDLKTILIDFLNGCTYDAG